MFTTCQFFIYNQTDHIYIYIRIYIKDIDHFLTWNVLVKIAF